MVRTKRMLEIYSSTANDSEAGRLFGSREGFAKARRAKHFPQKGRRPRITKAARIAAHETTSSAADACRQLNEPLATFCSAIRSYGLLPKATTTRRVPQGGHSTWGRISEYEEKIRLWAHANMRTDLEAADYCAIAVSTWMAWKRARGLGPVLGKRLLTPQEEVMRAQKAIHRPRGLPRHERLRRIKAIGMSRTIKEAAQRLDLSHVSLGRWMAAEGYPSPKGKVVRNSKARPRRV